MDVSVVVTLRVQTASSAIGSVGRYAPRLRIDPVELAGGQPGWPDAWPPKPRPGPTVGHHAGPAPPGFRGRGGLPATAGPVPAGALLGQLSPTGARAYRRSDPAPGARRKQNRINPALTFDSLVARPGQPDGPDRRAARGRGTGAMYNPLFIYGGVGLP